MVGPADAVFGPIATPVISTAAASMTVFMLHPPWRESITWRHDERR
jgi:hypothetical protein